jgi:hypothetical protein
VDCAVRKKARSFKVTGAEVKGVEENTEGKGKEEVN